MVILEKTTSPHPEHRKLPSYGQVPGEGAGTGFWMRNTEADNHRSPA
jgi:hypothetical protein